MRHDLLQGNEPEITMITIIEHIVRKCMQVLNRRVVDDLTIKRFFHRIKVILGVDQLDSKVLGMLAGPDSGALR